VAAVASEVEIVEKLVRTYSLQRRTMYRSAVAHLDVAAGYRVQEAFFDAYFSGPVACYKVATMGSDDRGCGRLPQQNVLPSGSSLELASFYNVHVEPELFFAMDRDVGPAATADEILSSSRILPGFDLPDCRYLDGFDPTDQVSMLVDNSFASFVIVGAVSVPAASIDLPSTACVLSHNGEEIGSGTGATVRGNPVSAVEWLSSELAARGEILRAGVIVASGTLLYPPAAVVGQYTADFAGIGSVALEFT